MPSWHAKFVPQSEVAFFSKLLPPEYTYIAPLPPLKLLTPCSKTSNVVPDKYVDKPYVVSSST